MGIIISRNVVCHSWRVKYSISFSPKITSLGRILNENRTWEAVFVCSMLFLLRVAPLPMLHTSAPTEVTQVYMLCFNRWASWRLLGCKTGTQNLHQSGIELSAHKVHGHIHWPRQTRPIQTCIHTCSSYTPEIGGSISPTRTSSRLFPPPYISILYTNQFYTHTRTHTHTHIYICIKHE